jgi:GNAT superfamily N-acetyltransferase
VEEPSIGREVDVDAVAGLLSDRLYAFDVEATGLADGQRFAFPARDDDGTSWPGSSAGPGAVAASWTRACLPIRSRAGMELGDTPWLWVRADRRGRGLGTALLDRAEEVARSAGCDQVVLATHSFQAPALYVARGYHVVGEAPGYPRTG